MAGCAHGRLRRARGARAEAAQPAAFHPQATLHATFGSLSSTVGSREQLSHCPGLGERKVARLLEALTSRSSRAALPPPRLLQTVVPRVPT